MKSSLTVGKIFPTLFKYSIPIILTNVVQCLFNMADVAVLAFMIEDKTVADAAVAATGACGTIITLLVSLFTGFATGADVLVAKRTGRRDELGVRRATGTALTVGLLSGLILMAVAVTFARELLILTNCQPEFLDMATKYLRIYFFGMPAIMLYSFAAAILRATGDSFRPMIGMLISGVCNVGLNMLFIAAFDLTVEAVALATAFSNFIALVFVLVAMLKNKMIVKSELHNFRIRGEELIELVRVGIPTILCSISFYIANVVISAGVNSMSAEAMVANTASGQFDGIVYTVGFSIAIATSAMVGQNYGAKCPERIKRTILTSVIYTTIASLSVGLVFIFGSDFFLGLITENESVIELAKEKLVVLCLTYFVTSIMEIFAFSLRAIGKQSSTMIVGAICGLGIRCLWVYTVWPLKRTLPLLFSCYAISAGVAIVIYAVIYLKAIKKIEVPEKASVT